VITQDDLRKLRANDPRTPLPEKPPDADGEIGLGEVPTYPVKVLPVPAPELVRFGSAAGLPQRSGRVPASPGLPLRSVLKRR
jgi:hypothetical protein